MKYYKYNKIQYYFLLKKCNLTVLFNLKLIIF